MSSAALFHLVDKGLGELVVVSGIIVTVISISGCLSAAGVACLTAILSGADNRPPMLEKDIPLIWPLIEENGVTRPNKYSELSATEAIQADCDVKATNIILQGLPPEVYALVSNHKVTKELLERIQLLMQGTSLMKQERECKLYDEFNKFAYKKGETLREFYLRFSLLLNDMNIYNMTLEQFQVNIKFLNTLPPEWRKFVTDIKLVRDLHTKNVDKLYAYLGQHEFHANKYGSPYQSQQYLHTQSSTPLSITYPSNDFRSSVHHNVYTLSSSIPQVEYLPLVNQQPDFSQPDSGLIVPVFQKDNDPIDAINHMMSFLIAVITSRENDKEEEDESTGGDPNDKEEDEDEDEEEEQEHPPSADSVPPPVHRVTARMFVRAQTPISLPSEIEKAQQLEPKLYDGNVIQKTNAIVICDSKETLMLAFESRSKMLLKQKDPMMSGKKVDTKSVDYANSVNSKEPNPSTTPTQVEVPKELPKVSMSQEKDMVIKKLKERIKSLSGNMKEDKIKQELEEIETINIELDHRSAKNFDLNASLQEKVLVITDLKDNLRNLKGKIIVDEAAILHPIDPELLKGVNLSTSARGSQPSGNTKKDKIQQTPSRNVCPLTRITTTTKVPIKKPIALESNPSKPVVTLVYSRKPKDSRNNAPVSKSRINKSLSANKMEPIKSWGSTVSNVPSSSINECRLSKLFSGVDLFSGSRGNNLYTLSLGDMMQSSPICLLYKASKTKSWLWHRRLSHLNFGAINYLARQGLVRGLPKLKFEKDHLCSACAMGKSKKKSHKPKSEDTNQEKLYLLHMDLCGPMRVESVNEKKYILVTVDDYSRFTWAKCLRSKDKAPDFIIKFLGVFP
uniref:Integrase, catalytic region, zinc finger, CCHC-type, peptidase aspartic, catalytic n=1 Tax=Tanacetum cinerariifolium TaxID=118510 RepID=A0A6L2MQN2_TANCI|nr:integrase, catalytic region, zinc finger, CCHC-type, peptidase aspartic, catalytic [Tanacetum cinerariifolium]